MSFLLVDNQTYLSNSYYSFSGREQEPVNLLTSHFENLDLSCRGLQQSQEEIPILFIWGRQHRDSYKYSLLPVL